MRSASAPSEMSSPEMIGGAVFTGGGPVTALVCAESAEVVP